MNLYVQSEVRLERRADGIAIVTLADETGDNALNERLCGDLDQVLRACGADPDVRVVVLRGNDRVFCSGGDLSMLELLAQGETAPSDLHLPRLIFDVPVPVIAAVEGHAVGGGLALTLACDVVVLAREARYGCSFMNMGFTPGMGISGLLRLAVGDWLAAEMLYGGKFFRGAHFEGRSGFNAVLPRGQVWATAIDMAERIAEKPRFALELLKLELVGRKRGVFEQAHAAEAHMHRQCFGRAETLDRIRREFVPSDGSRRAP